MPVEKSSMGKKLIHEYGKEKGTEIFYAIENLRKHHGKSATRQY